MNKTQKKYDELGKILVGTPGPLKETEIENFRKKNGIPKPKRPRRVNPLKLLRSLPSLFEENKR